VVFKSRKVVILIAAVLYAVYGFGTFQIPASNSMDSILKPSHPIQQGILWRELEMWRGDAVQTVFYTFGVQPKLWADPTQRRWGA